MENNENQKAPRDAKDNVVFIGQKPFMNYVTGVVMQFTTQGAAEVVIKARGKFMSRAIDVAEVAAKRFLEGTVETKDIKIDSEEFENKGHLSDVCSRIVLKSLYLARMGRPDALWTPGCQLPRERSNEMEYSLR